MKKLTKEQKRQAAVIAAKTDADIDLSDAREELDWSGGYQTRVNALLRHAMNSRWAARHDDEALRQKAQAAYDGLHAKRASGSIKRIHADKLSARMKDDSRASARVRLR
jgi:hypothetical protein